MEVGTPCYYDTRWLNRLWCTQSTVEGVVKAALHCGSDSSVADDPAVVPGSTTLYVDLQPT